MECLPGLPRPTAGFRSSFVQEHAWGTDGQAQPWIKSEAADDDFCFEAARSGEGDQPFEADACDLPELSEWVFGSACAPQLKAAAPALPTPCSPPSSGTSKDSGPSAIFYAAPCHVRRTPAIKRPVSMRGNPWPSSVRAPPAMTPSAWRATDCSGSRQTAMPLPEGGMSRQPSGMSSDTVMSGPTSTTPVSKRVHLATSTLSPTRSAALPQSKLLDTDMASEYKALQQALALPTCVEELPDCPLSSLDEDMLSCLEKRGRGGRNRAADARLDPMLDPRKAERIMANRMSAAKSKLKQRLAQQGKQVKLDVLLKQRDRLAAEVAHLEKLCEQLDTQSAGEQPQP